jgi:hypothetical protein
MSPLQFPPSPSLTPRSILSWGYALFRTASPLLAILLHGKIKYFVSRMIYRPIYKTLPRPTGDSMFSGLSISAPTMEYDTPDRQQPNARTQYRTEDEYTLRALEGLPVLDSSNNQPQQSRNYHDSSDEDDDDEMAHPTLISFDVEATEPVEAALGTWSAELRSANEPKLPSDTQYLVTGLTMLPPIMATEGLREILAGILVLPIEASMVRIISRAHRASAGLPTDDLYFILPSLPSFAWGNIVSVLAIQLTVTGVVWAGFTASTLWWTTKHRVTTTEESGRENSSN